MPDRDRIRRRDQGDFDEEDRQAQALRRLLEQDDDVGRPQAGLDVPMGLTNRIELPHGAQLSIGVNLDYGGLESSLALEGTDELWAPEEVPPELSKEGTEQALSFLRDVGVYRLVPLNQTTAEEQQKALSD